MNRVRGFTLLEMVVAIGIFSIIAAISYTSLSRFLDTRDFIGERLEKLRTLQNAMAMIERDIRFMVNRPVRDGFGDEEIAVASGGVVLLAEGEILRLTVSQPDTGVIGSSRLRRVAWRLLDGELQRVTWAVLDRDQDSPESVRTMMKNVDAAVVRYFFYSDEDSLESGPEWTFPAVLPVGVEFLLTIRGGEEYRRLFTVAGNT